MKTILIALFFSIAAPAFIGCMGPREEQQQEPQGVLIVANKSGDNVHFVDRATGEVLAELPAGEQPHEVVVSTDGATAVVANYGTRDNPGNTLSVYDVGEARLVTTIDLGEHYFPHGMQWMPQRPWIMLTAEGSGKLLIVDILNHQVVQAFETNQQVSHMVAATPDMSKAFVPDIRSGNVTVVDLQTGEVIAQIYSGEGAEGIDASPDGREIWVTNRAENTISIINTTTLEVEEKIACEDFPIRAKFSPGGEWFLVSNARSGTIGVFDVEERSLIRYIALTPPEMAGEGQQRYFEDFEGSSVPIGLVIPDNKFAYVANTHSDAISVIDLERMEITGHFMVGHEPDGIGFSPVYPSVQQTIGE